MQENIALPIVSMLHVSAAVGKILTLLRFEVSQQPLPDIDIGLALSELKGQRARDRERYRSQLALIELIHDEDVEAAKEEMNTKVIQSRNIGEENDAMQEYIRCREDLNRKQLEDTLKVAEEALVVTEEYAKELEELLAISKGQGNHEGPVESKGTERMETSIKEEASVEDNLLSTNSSADEHAEM